jgi:acetyl-CoA carboxylase biotin carboxylase subunit
MTIRRILVANRGEIARRVFRSCRALGIETVAVYSDADADAPFVREADVPVRVGPAASAASYLNVEAVLAAAQKAGADAIHPGYGFLAENAAFARAVMDAGLTWIGPGPDAIDAMGLKREAKRAAQEAGVPVVPGYDGPLDDATVARTAAAEVGYPLLVKASAGGGGKGMRVVTTESELDDALATARRESAAAFGDDTLLIERYVELPRHVEIQVFGDAHGNVVHLFERECSIQRRHQKVIEESPSVALTPALRQAMGDAAVAVAQAIGYVSAGTVEFIVDARGDFFFLEMNTRLQVEHPVTEAITGLDLVALQIAVAEGKRLPFSQTDVVQKGAAVECRLYAEDADAGFLPATGTLEAWIGRHQDGVRVDAGVEAGDVISVHYDPMIAKIVTWGEDREEARRKMADALGRMALAGVVTNLAFLRRVLEHPEYVAGQIDTHFIERNADALVGVAERPGAVLSRAVAATLVMHARRDSNRTLLPSVRPGFRSTPSTPTPDRLSWAGGEVAVRAATLDRDAPQGPAAPRRYDVTVSGITDADERAEVTARDVELSAPGSRACCTITLEHDGLRRRYQVAELGGRIVVLGAGGVTEFRVVPRFGDAAAQQDAGGCRAPMPGKVIAVRVSAGDAVEAGDALVVLEAMKMEHTIRAPEAGVVREVLVTEGAQVEADAVLAVIE